MRRRRDRLNVLVANRFMLEQRDRDGGTRNLDTWLGKWIRASCLEWHKRRDRFLVLVCPHGPARGSGDTVRRGARRPAQTHKNPMMAPRGYRPHRRPWKPRPRTARALWCPRRRRPPAHVRCTGKGRKNRITPLTPTTTAVLEVWLAERASRPDEPAFPTARGGRLTRDALDHRIIKYTEIAAQRCPTLHEKGVTPHTLRHTAAMRLLHAGVDTTVIALWLGHERVDTTQIYLHADLALKERAIARTTPPDTRPGRYKPPDTLLAFLQAL